MQLVNDRTLPIERTIRLLLVVALAITVVTLAGGTLATAATDDHDLEVEAFELQQDDEIVASVDGDEWDDELPEIKDPPGERYGGFVAVDLDAVVVDEDDNEIDLGEEAGYELRAEPQDETAEELLRIEEHGDSVVLDGEGHGTADVVFQIRDADGVEYETPVTTVDVDVPPGVNFLAETAVDHDHAAFHGEVDARTAVEGGDSPGDGPVLEDDHVYWNVTYDGSAGYVTYDTTEHDSGYEGPFVFYVANGAAEPVNANVIERDEVGEIEGAGNVYETDTIEEYFVVETPDDGTIDFRISDGESVDGLAAQNNFAGIVSDDEPLHVSGGDLTDPDGNAITDEATVKVLRNGTVLAESDAVTIDDGELSGVDIDTDAIDPEVEPGPATVTIDGVETDSEAQVELVHEAQNLEDGYTLQSLPQSGSVQTEGVESIERWNPAEETYVSLGSASDDGEVLDAATDLHRGFYVDAQHDGRIGYTFETDGVPTPGDVTLEDGWHLASANFALGEAEGSRSLDDDLVNLDPDDDGITVYDDRQRTPLEGSSTIDGFDSYWVYVDDPIRNDRAVIDPNYDPSARTSVLEGETADTDGDDATTDSDGVDTDADGDVTDDGDDAEETTGDGEGDDVDTTPDETDDTSDAESTDPHPDDGDDHEEATDAGAEDDGSDETAQDGSDDEIAEDDSDDETAEDGSDDETAEDGSDDVSTDSEMADETNDEELESETGDEDRE